jgi:hypothetical protein
MKTGSLIFSQECGVREMEHGVSGKTTGKFLWEIQGYVAAYAPSSLTIHFWTFETYTVLE